MHIMLVISVLSTLKKVSVYYLPLLVLNWHMLIMVVTSVLSAVKKSEHLSVLNSTYQRKKKTTFSFNYKEKSTQVGCKRCDAHVWCLANYILFAIQVFYMMIVSSWLLYIGFGVSNSAYSV